MGSDPLSSSGSGSQHPTETLAFRGDLRFAGHSGMLYVRIADPWLSLSGGHGELSVLDPYKPDHAPRLTLVTLDITESREQEGHLLLSAPDVFLTADGCDLFNDGYQAGERFDPVTLAVPLTRR